MALTTVVASATSPAIALEMVKKLGLGSNFSTLAMTVASSTQTFRMIQGASSPQKAKALLTEHLQRTLPKYQAQWDSNLAVSYAEVLSDEEMASLATDGRNSPYVGKLMGAAREVGTKMQAKSSNLLTKATTEALASAFAASRK